MAVFSTIISIGLTIVSTAYQYYRQKQARKKAEREADKQKGMKIQSELSADMVPLVYGLQPVSGLTVWAETRDNYVHTNYYKDIISAPGNHGGWAPMLSLTSSNWVSVATKPIPPRSPIIVYGSRAYVRNSTPYQSGQVSDVSSFVEQYLTMVSTFNILQAVIAGTVTGPTADTLRSHWYWTPEEHATYNSSVMGQAHDQMNSSSRDAFSMVAYMVLPNKNYWFTPSSSPAFQFVHHHHLTGSINADKKTFLFTQQAICVGGINRVITAIVDGKAINDKSFNYGQRIQVKTNGTGATDPMILANCPSRGPNAKFSRMAHASCCFRLNRDKPQYGDIPNVEYIIEGMRVPTIEFVGGQYRLSSAKTYSTNPARCLVDYLTNPVHGRGLPLSRIDLASMYQFQNICERNLASVKAYGYYAMSKGNAEDPKRKGGGTQVTLPLYECNVTLDTSQSIFTNVGRILESVPGAEMVWINGKYKVVYPYARSEAEQNALIVATYNDGDLISESISEAFPSQDERMNQVIMRFGNAERNFESWSETWPKTSSSVYNTYLSADNNKLLRKEENSSTAIHRLHARLIAETTVRQSRSTKVYTLTLRRKGLLLEPGDIIRIQSQSLNFDNVMRVVEIEPGPDMTCKITAHAFSWQNFGDVVADNEPGITTPGGDTFTAIPEGLSYTANHVANNKTSTSGTLTWNYDEGSNNRFELSYRVKGDSRWITLGQTTSRIFFLPALNSNTYIFRVQAIGSGGYSLPDLLEQEISPESNTNTVQHIQLSELPDEPATNGQRYYITNLGRYVTGDGEYWRRDDGKGIVTRKRGVIDFVNQVFYLGGVNYTQDTDLIQGDAAGTNFLWTSGGDINEYGANDIHYLGNPLTGRNEGALHTYRLTGFVPGPYPATTANYGWWPVGTAVVNALPSTKLGMLQGLRLSSNTAGSDVELICNLPGGTIVSGRTYYMDLLYAASPGQTIRFRPTRVSGGSEQSWVDSVSGSDQGTNLRTNAGDIQLQSDVVMSEGLRMKRFIFTPAFSGVDRIVIRLLNPSSTSVALELWNLAINPNPWPRPNLGLIPENAELKVKFNLNNANGYVENSNGAKTNFSGHNFVPGQGIPKAVDAHPIRKVIIES